MAKLRRTLIDNDGRALGDYGETPDDQFTKIENLELLDEGGATLMTSDPVDVGMMREMAEWVEGPKVLEVGYGMGYSYIKMRERGIVQDVCEADRSVFDIAKKHYPERLMSMGNVFYGPYGVVTKEILDNTYDTVFFDIDANEPLLLYKDKALLDETHRLLVDGGLYVPYFSPHFTREEEIPVLPKFGLEETKLVSTFIGDPNYRKNITKSVRLQEGKATKGRLDELEEKHVARNTRSYWIAKYRKLS